MELTITDWRAPDSRQRALDFAEASRAYHQEEGEFDGEKWLDALGAAIDACAVPDDYRIEAKVSYFDDPTGAWQVSIWFRVWPPPEPEPEAPSE